jgi:hypothetical protein
LCDPKDVEIKTRLKSEEVVAENHKEVKLPEILRAV